VGIFPEWEDSRGDHGLGRLEEFRFKVPITKREGIHWNAPQLDTVIAKLHIFKHVLKVNLRPGV